MKNKQFSLQQAVSPFARYCVGYGNPGASGSSYIVGLNLGIGKVPKELSHKGSNLLDEINAFDRAEIDAAYIGQINMVTVSSFCGPMGAIWGYHLVKSKKMYRQNPYFPEGEIHDGKRIIPVFDAQPLFEATKMLFGTVGRQRFPLLPGSHVPCATKKMILYGPGHIYACLGLGVAEDRLHVAHLLMEDVGSMHHKITDAKEEKAYKHMILHNKVKSILEIGHNQQVRYKEIFIGMKDMFIKKEEVGCALVTAPYFALAQQAIPTASNTDLEKMTLEEWERTIFL